ncbi:MAG: glycosyltransferase family 2 protein [Chloroflexi bacterium]|nr:glycosyltransferase family 2 protein [Chloroflexota bacterium]
MRKPGQTPSVDVVIPVYNEERDLPRCVARLREFLKDAIPHPWCVVVADNGSTDRTLDIAKELASQHPGQVAYIHLPEKGRGRALKRVWLERPADILSYMDVDLSTDLAAFPPLVAAIAEEGFDIAIGSRLRRGARVERGLKREMLSRGYNLLIRAMLWTHFADAQCGFKAISRQAAQAILPLVRDTQFFFDTELLIIAEKRGFHIKEIPVHWVDDPDTRVRIFRTVSQDIRGLLRLRFGGIPQVEAPAHSESAKGR